MIRTMVLLFMGALLLAAPMHCWGQVDPPNPTLDSLIANRAAAGGSQPVYFYCPGLIAPKPKVEHHDDGSFSIKTNLMWSAGDLVVHFSQDSVPLDAQCTTNKGMISFTCNDDSCSSFRNGNWLETFPVDYLEVRIEQLPYVEDYLRRLRLSGVEAARD